MTMSDLERPDAGVKYFRGISLITLAPFDLIRTTKFGRITLVGRGVFTGG